MTTEAPADPTAMVDLLVAAAAGDTLMRDAYLRRARALLEPVCTESRYRQALEERAAVDRMLAQSRVAVGRQEWRQVEELATRAAQLRHGLQADAAALAAAERVYDAPPVALDPFSRGVGPLADVDPSHARADTLASLEALAARDAANQQLYAARRRAIMALVPADSAASTTTNDPEVTPERRALAAAERGDPDELRRLAQQMREAAGRPAAQATAGPGRRFEAPAVLAQPFPDTGVTAARALGLEHVEFVERTPAAATTIRAFLEQYAWTASAATHERARDGVAMLRQTFDTLPALDAATADIMAETVSLFALHLFVNSAGIRYLPMLAAREYVLLETHPEGDDGISGLVRALGLDRRRAVARDEIERALLLRGGDVLTGMSLDPVTFRIVCVPADVYMRVAPARGWGAREEWTHFDGYQVRKAGRLLALVGGNARYGGVADLCGIGAADARDNVVARFAVIRRERLGARLV